eukprot:jgi/Bigna1/136064/aug1.32_g10772
MLNEMLFAEEERNADFSFSRLPHLSVLEVTKPTDSKHSHATYQMSRTKTKRKVIDASTMRSSCSNETLKTNVQRSVEPHSTATADEDLLPHRKRKALSEFELDHQSRRTEKKKRNRLANNDRMGERLLDQGSFIVCKCGCICEGNFQFSQEHT